MDRPEILDLVEKISRKKGFQKCEIKDFQSNQKGEGFVGQVFYARIQDGKGKFLDLVMKAAFQSPSARRNVPIRHAFENEVFFYKDVLKVLKEFSKSDLGFVPKCHDVSLQEEAEVLVLENLRSLGFECFDKKKELDDAHVRLILKTYGQFHGISMALRDQNPELFSKITKFHQVFREVVPTIMESMFTSDSQLLLDSLVPGKDEDLVSKFGKIAGKTCAKIFDDVLADPSDHPVLLHGDCWSNNMMFKYQEAQPTDIRLLDFQMCRVGSPVGDLSYCLYSGASKDVLDNLNEYLKVYHESLAKTLRRLGSDPQIYPFSTLKSDWKRYSKFGMIMGMSVIKIKTANQEDFIDLSEDADAHSKLKDVKYDREVFTRRGRALLRHCVDFGVL